MWCVRVCESDVAQDIVAGIARISAFYKHESCGQCTPYVAFSMPLRVPAFDARCVTCDALMCDM